MTQSQSLQQQTRIKMLVPRIKLKNLVSYQKATLYIIQKVYSAPSAVGRARCHYGEASNFEPPSFRSHVAFK